MSACGSSRHMAKENRETDVPRGGKTLPSQQQHHPNLPLPDQPWVVDISYFWQPPWHCCSLPARDGNRHSTKKPVCKFLLSSPRNVPTGVNAEPTASACVQTQRRLALAW
ncbi:unnamed protein product [Bubo scandiacus]